MNSATAGFGGYRLALAVASSHMVITEPVPDVIEEIGWTGGENIHDCRTLLHYFRTTNDGRIALGWGGGRMGFGGRHTRAARHRRRRRATRRGRAAALSSRSSHGRADHARLGRADRRLPHPPADLRLARAASTTASASPATASARRYLGGEILARLALDRRDELTGLAIVEPDRKLMPPEPLRWAGGTAIRAALVRRDAAYDRGDEPDPVTGFVASLPRRLGLRLPR